MKHYDAILAAVKSNQWLIYPPKMDELMGVLSLRVAGGSVDSMLVEMLAAENRDRRQPQIVRSVAILPIMGTISQRMSMLEESSGGASTEQIGREFDRLMTDDQVGAVILNIDSPGGTAYGVMELADKIMAARGTKPVIAIGNSLAASAAYWIGSAAESFSITPSGEAGSIGALCVHCDESKLNEIVGLNYSYIVSGVSPNKAEYAPDAPLSDDARAELQRRIDDLGETFVKAVAKQRGLPAKKVQADFGQGRVFGAKEALDRQMVDRIETLDELVLRLATGKRGKQAGARMAIERERLRLAGA